MLLRYHYIYLWQYLLIFMVNHGIWIPKPIITCLHWEIFSPIILHLLSQNLFFLGDNSSHIAQEVGFVILQLKSGQHLYISNILYVPRLKKNLLWVAQLCKTWHIEIKFISNTCIMSIKSLWINEIRSFSISKQDNLFSLDEGVLSSHINDNNRHCLLTTLQQSHHTTISPCTDIE